MLSLSYLFEVIPDSIEYTSDPITEPAVKIWKAKMKQYQDSQMLGSKLYDMLHPPPDDSAFQAAQKAAKKAAQKASDEAWAKKVKALSHK